MKAVVVNEFGGPEVLRVMDLPKPVPDPDQVLIRVLRSSVNFADIKARQGRYHGAGQPPFIPGLDAAGIVSSVGSLVDDIAIGSFVVAFPHGGSYAEYVTASRELVFPIPRNLDWDVAAALPTVAFTSYKLLHDIGRLESGDKVLIHAAAGGVGTTAIQLARILGASTIYGTVSDDDKRPAAEAAGADHVINYRERDFVQELRELTSGQGVDLILDSVGGTISERSMEILAPFGRLVHFGSASGQIGTIRVSDLHATCRSVLGFSLGTVRATRPHLLKPVAAAVLNYVVTGQLTMHIGRKYPLDEAALAHQWMESRASTGKILLEISR